MHLLNVSQKPVPALKVVLVFRPGLPGPDGPKPGLPGTQIKPIFKPGIGTGTGSIYYGSNGPIPVPFRFSGSKCHPYQRPHGKVQLLDIPL